MAYLVNQYPRTSHSFIRRELQAVEALGVEVLRVSVRPVEGTLASAADREEATRTRFLLGSGIAGLLGGVVAVASRHPLRFAAGAALAVRIGRSSDRGLLRHLAYLAEACVLLRWLRAAGIDHLHAHFGTNPAAVAAICGALGGPPFSFTVHGPEEFDRPAGLALSEKIRRAAFTVAISSFGRSQLWRWARHADWGKVEVVRCGLDADLLDAPVTPPPEAPRLACVARLDAQKGHLVLLEAARQLEQEGVEFEVVLVGDGPLRTAIEARIRELGLGARFRLAGWLGEAGVREAIASARALILPSFAEGLPVVLMEAFALGRPAITTAIAGIPELVEAGATGWLVPAGSVEALAAAMREALGSSPARLEAMGRAGKALVARRHDARREAAALVELFRRSSRTRGR